MRARKLTPVAIWMTSAGLLSAAAFGWWALIGSARIAPLPPPAPDEGQEAALQQAYLEALVRKRPGNWQARAALAARLSQEGRDGEAVRHLSRAIQAQPGDVNLNRALAYLAGRVGFLDEEIRAWREIARRRDRDLEARVRLATLYRRLGWDVPARVAAEQALRISPRDPEALRVRAVLAFSQKDYPGALRFSRQLLAVDPSNAVAHSIQSKSLEASGRWQEAVAEAVAAQRAAREVPDYSIDLARLYLAAPQGPASDRALKILNAAPVPDPQAEQALRYWRGVCYVQLGRTEEALADLGFVERRSRDYEQVTLQLSKVWRQRGDNARADAYLLAHQQIESRRLVVRRAEAAVRQGLEQPLPHLRLAQAALAAGDPARAVVEARVVLRLKPQDVEAERVLRDALRKMNRTDETGS